MSTTYTSVSLPTVSTYPYETISSSIDYRHDPNSIYMMYIVERFLYVTTMSLQSESRTLGIILWKFQTICLASLGFRHERRLRRRLCRKRCLCESVSLGETRWPVRNIHRFLGFYTDRYSTCTHVRWLSRILWIVLLCCVLVALQCFGWMHGLCHWVHSNGVSLHFACWVCRCVCPWTLQSKLKGEACGPASRLTWNKLCPLKHSACTTFCAERGCIPIRLQGQRRHGFGTHNLEGTVAMSFFLSISVI